MPDFSIRREYIGINIYWEHLGLLSDRGYRSKWLKKRDWYESEGELSASKKELDQNGVLFTSKDNRYGAIDSTELNLIIANILKLKMKANQGDIHDMYHIRRDISDHGDQLGTSAD